MGSAELGKTLFDLRDLRGRSLKSVADEAEISAAYLQKLERGTIKAPSPHVLYALAKALDTSYAKLMELTGYVVPTRGRRPADSGVSVLAQALNGEVTEEEAEVLARYLRWYRQDQRRRR